MTTASANTRSNPSSGGPRPLLVVMPSLRRGGAERHAVLIATTVDRSRWTPHVLAFAGGPWQHELEDAGVSVEIADVGNGIRAVPGARTALAASIARVRPAAISGYDVLVELAARALAYQQPLPLLVWKHTYGHIGLRGRREQIVERVSGSRVTRYGAVCHTQVRYLTDELGIDPRRIRVVPNTVRPIEMTAVDHGSAAHPTAEPTVAFVAAMRADKGHVDALNAWATVVRAIPTARLLLAGDGPERAALEARVQDMGLSGSVEFLGELADTRAVVERCDIVLLASYAIECFPYVGLEAMALGRAMVSTDVGGLPEMVDDGVTGHLVPPHDPAALARELIVALSDRDATAQRGIAARERLHTVFPFERWRTQIDQLLGEVASNQTPQEHS